VEKVYFARIAPEAIIPSKREEDAGYDIYPCFDDNFMVIKPHETRMIPTGIASAFSPDYYFQLFERGSTGTKGMGQRSGVIDSGYRNEWVAPITNHNDKYLIIIKENISKSYVLEELFGIMGDTNVNNYIFYPYEKAICQAILLPVPKVEIQEIFYNDLVNIKSERGLGRLGSTSK
jgi:dUTP pyrophosphatase